MQNRELCSCFIELGEGARPRAPAPDRQRLPAEPNLTRKNVNQEAL
jgi:hypothetical protein